MKLHKGDTVKIMIGKDRDKTGKITNVSPAANMIVIDGLNVFKKHQRPKKQGEKGEMINVSRPMNASRVRFLCPNCKKPTRLGYRLEGEKENQKKNRYCKKCQNLV
ncbi:MAG: 50S ribosomal protein L24 [Candidatus Harrisonbacteria bacterium RIFCSPLOWO2_02_FULL_41_13b]|uniref:Large ribosomal subunit protein uL24 n=1 Tax=Candidatus Harrisonbacteria bacterium RIFCSPLOWO2_02_FULL_41_13b TaxID=1798409 RepID=A0A1G1ZPU7_9BACT|nr:MAG: 50S ribosomal protein L24 [Candidatus Harrisonbacteria bacterium RIFCSPHIGHO2_02_FULL_40_20]OGY66708.1 MAG: 50S ribosomal protein L24 [Candidatus Harrisonbacteria bacterium RIFCSPLOWO2_02_FULL_41_13b]